MRRVSSKLVCFRPPCIFRSCVCKTCAKQLFNQVTFIRIKLGSTDTQTLILVLFFFFSCLHLYLSYHHVLVTFYFVFIYLLLVVIIGSAQSRSTPTAWGVMGRSKTQRGYQRRRQLWCAPSTGARGAPSRRRRREGCFSGARRAPTPIARAASPKQR